MYRREKYGWAFVVLTKTTELGELDGNGQLYVVVLTFRHVISLNDTSMLTIPITTTIQQDPGTFRPPVIKGPQVRRRSQLGMYVCSIKQTIPIRIDRRGVVRGFELATRHETVDGLGSKDEAVPMA
jgi:hypothetical protein